MSEIVCEKKVCSRCASPYISLITLIDSEVYCVCRHCGLPRLSCSDAKEKECNNKIIGAD